INMTKITRFNVIAQHKLQDIIASSPKMPNSHIINRVRNLAKSFSIPKTGIPIFSPANTAHPTNIFDRNYEMHKHKGTLHNQHPVMPSKNLSVTEEVARKIFYLQNIMESIPQVMQNLGIDNYHEYNNLLDLHSWAGCDADGNINITHETMQDALKQSQDCVINFAENHIVNLINNDNRELKNIALSMQNVMQDLKSQKSSNGIIEQSHINLAQTQLLNLIHTLDVSSNSDLKHLVFILNNIGLSGYKLDVRQSSKVIDVCANDMANIVAKYGQDVNDDIKNYAKKNENTNQIEQPSEKVISSLINNKNHINTIIQHKDELSKVSQLELNRMLLIQEHTDVFKTYQISDERNDNDVYFMRFMEKLAQISTNKETSQNTDFVMLAETEDDIKNLFENTQKIINKGLFANNRIQIFVGYSDAQKKWGYQAS
ncbi:MAG: hypothetical protein RLZZ210_1653, partial [Pseudomonadota bacterium]